MLLDTAAHYYNYQETSGFQSALSPPPSPFSDNYFTFPTSASEHGQWTYHGYNSAQSPLLSASASDIPETVRYSGSHGISQGLSHLQEMGYGVHEAFGHDLGYSQSASLYNTNTNYQVNTFQSVSQSDRHLLLSRSSSGQTQPRNSSHRPRRAMTACTAPTLSPTMLLRRRMSRLLMRRPSVPASVSGVTASRISLTRPSW